MPEPKLEYPKPPQPDQLTYSSYLKVSELLELQTPLSTPAEHDEMLFIIIHQAYELWFKQLIHEIKACQTFLDKDELMRVMAGLKRVDTIQKVLIHQVDILETMAPDDFARFRDKLNPASGFQSYQFRIFECLMGIKNELHLRFHQDHTSAHKELAAALTAPSLYDSFLNYLKRQGLTIPATAIGRDGQELNTPIPELVDTLQKVYESPYEYSAIYLALEALIDIDEQLSLWRYRHKSMVERMIGDHRGTGGSSGARYLAQTITVKCFPEIWAVRNHLGTSS